MNNLHPLVSVFCPTFNHENYIRECLNGIVMQKTAFQIEVIVQDDASTDKTLEIIEKYAKTHLFINSVTHAENYFSKGRSINEYLFQNAKGKYIAICEGDDYWTDPLKLQKQVDFMEANPEFSCCFHDTYLKRGEEITTWRIYDKEEFTILDTFSNIALFHTSSILFKREALYLPAWFPKIVSGDMAIQSIVASKGKLKRIPEFMSVYRKHRGSITETDKVIRNYHKNRIELMNFLNKEFKNKYKKEIKSVISFHKHQIKRERSFFKKLKQIIRIPSRFIING